jgi:hypothetical protein
VKNLLGIGATASVAARKKLLNSPFPAKVEKVGFGVRVLSEAVLKLFSIGDALSGAPISYGEST